jgi:hypothetical protein
VFASSPGWPRVQRGSTSSSEGEASGEYQNESSRFCIRRQGSSMLPRSSLRALSGRVAHPPERLSCSLLFRPTRSANCPRPTFHKPTRSSCAANPRRCVPATTCCGSRPREEPIRSGARPDSTARCGRAATSGIDSGRTRRRRFRPIASGRRQSDAERGIGSDPTLNVEGEVGRNETLNVEGGLGGECRVINRRAG